MPAKAFHVDPHIRPAPGNDESEEEDEEDLVDLLDFLKDLSITERRQVYALKGLLNDFREKRKEFLEEQHKMEEAVRADVEPLLTRRKEIVTGEKDITDEELQKAKEMLAKEGDDVTTTAPEEKKKGVQVKDPLALQEEEALRKAAEDPHGGIPGFWLGALKGTTELSEVISERDVAALQHLQNIETVPIEGKRGSFSLVFTFGPNEFFTNEKLTKTYYMVFDEYEEDFQVDDVKGDEIHWTSPDKNLTILLKEKKQRNKKTKEIRIVTKQEKCPSFFNFFQRPKLFALDHDESVSSDEDEEDDEDFLNQEAEMDMELAQVLSEQVIPQAASCYSGKHIERIARELLKQFGGLGMDDDDDDDDDDDEEEDGTPGQFSNIAQRGRGRGRGGAPAGRGRGGADQQECKQQ